MPEQVVAEPTPQESVEQVEETTQQPTPVETNEQSQTPPSPEGVPEGEVDERGVPYKNRYMEAQRKLQSIQNEYQGFQSNLPNLIQDAVAKAIPQSQQQPQYTKEQLIQFKNETEDSKNRAWAENELEKIRSKETEDIFKRHISQSEDKVRYEHQRQMTYQQVVNEFPVMFNTDGTFDNTHPLTQKLSKIFNASPEFANHPQGLAIAARAAFGEYARELQPNLVKKQTTLKRQVKKLERATQLEGAGQFAPQTEGDTYTRAFKNLEAKGDKNSTTAFVKELLKKRGTI